MCGQRWTRQAFVGLMFAYVGVSIVWGVLEGLQSEYEVCTRSTDKTRIACERGTRTPVVTWLDSQQAAYAGEFKVAADTQRVVMHGQGTYTDNDVAPLLEVRYEGHLTDDMPHGHGVLQVDERNLLLKGHWERGVLAGGECAFRARDFVDMTDMEELYQVVDSITASMACDQCEDGLPHGMCEVVLVVGDDERARRHLSAEYVAGLLHGPATLTLGNGERVFQLEGTAVKLNRTENPGFYGPLGFGYEAVLHRVLAPDADVDEATPRAHSVACTSVLCVIDGKSLPADVVLSGAIMGGDHELWLTMQLLISMQSYIATISAFTSTAITPWALSLA